MENDERCERCQIKPISFKCDNCKPYTQFCSQCDTFVHSLPLRMNHSRKQIANTINNSYSFRRKKSIEKDQLPQKDIQYPYNDNENNDANISVKQINNKSIDNIIMKDARQLEIENKQLQKELFNLTKLKNQQDDLKDDIELFYETKLSQLNKDNIALKQDKENIQNELSEQSSIINQLQKQIKLLNNQLKDKNKEIQAQKEKYKDLDGFYKFKFEEMQKEKDYLLHQIPSNASYLSACNIEDYNHNPPQGDYRYQLPIKDNSA